MSADEVEAFIDSLPDEKKPDDGAALAKELVRQKKLTKFQAQAIYQGKTKLDPRRLRRPRPDWRGRDGAGL